MYNNQTFLAIIPARGGSKRLPRKNVLDLYGKPMILWTIQAGLHCKYIDKLVVTSDNDEILNLAKNSGTETIKRPESLSTDFASTIDVVKHVIANFEKYDFIVLLQPTSPLRSVHHIDDAIKLLNEKKADAVVSVCEMDHSPLWSNTIDSSLSMSGFLSEEVENKRSQDLEKYFRLNGAIYICRTKSLLEENRFILKNNTFAFKMDRRSSVDVDDKIDFTVAACLLEEKNV